MINSNYICKHCRFNTKYLHFVKNGDDSICPKCGKTGIIRLGIKARIPRKTASKSKWKKFLDRFNQSTMYKYNQYENW